MAKVDSIGRSNGECLNVDFMRSLVKQYSELGQWSSAFFWADAAAASANDIASGDDIWLLASAMLARGELHRAAHAVTSRGLHRRHLLCLGVAMRAYISAREPASALSLIEECDTPLLDSRSQDQTHNRALASVLLCKARALTALERREAAVEALTTALRIDCACYEALDLLLEHHALTPRQETELVESLPIGSQVSGAEAVLLKTAYRERLLRYSPLKVSQIDNNRLKECEGITGSNSMITVDLVLSKSSEGAARKARRLAAAGHWAEALKYLDVAGPWACADVRAACLVELKKSSELFAFAHALVDAYPQSWTSWFAVGCYYYLIGKSEFARRYLSKAKSLEPGAGCVWLAYGHSFAADGEHDQAMAAYFKASQLMAGCHLPPLYVAVECSLLNNVTMCERFMLRAATLHSDAEGAEAAEAVVDEADAENTSGWERVVRVVCDPYVAHEAGAAAYAAGDNERARVLWLRALHEARDHRDQLHPRWAATMDGLGHACRALGDPRAALHWHEQALALRPARAATLAAKGLCLALLGRTRAAADELHAALARDPDDVVGLALLDAVIERLDAAITEEDIPQFPFPTVNLSPRAHAHTPVPHANTTHTLNVDATNTSDMSMSFD